MLAFLKLFLSGMSVFSRAPLPPLLAKVTTYQISPPLSANISICHLLLFIVYCIMFTVLILLCTVCCLMCTILTVYYLKLIGYCLLSLFTIYC